MSNLQNTIIAEAKQEAEEEVCKYCKDLDEMEWDSPDEPHHGDSADCPECEADYYREYSGKIWATNDKAKLNHPELEKL